MGMIEDCRTLSDDDLEKELRFLAARDRHAMARLLVHLAEYDSRQLAVKRWHSNLFAYCVRVLGFEEGDAYRRIRAARVVKRWGEVLPRIEAGKLHLSALVSLSPVLTDENRGLLFQRAEGKTRREIEAIAAEIVPVPARLDWMRRVPAAGGWSAGVVGPIIPNSGPISRADAAAADTPGNPIAPADGAAVTPGAAMPGDEPRDGVDTTSAVTAPMGTPWEWQAVVPLGLERVRIGFDAASGLMRMIERARQVLRHKYPEGRLEDIMRDALEILLERKDPQRRMELKDARPRALTTREREERVSGVEPPVPVPMRDPAHGGRYIPAKVKDAVWRRDDGRCAWRFEDGIVCGSRDFLEYDHIVPFARGGRSDNPRNIRLLCRMHNALAAERAGLARPGGRVRDAAERGGLSAGGG